MRTTAITNLKGGTGKTTVAVNLAAALVSQGRRVLLVDLDGQQNAAESLGFDGQDDSLYRVFQGEALPLASLVETTKMPGLDLLRGSDALYKVERTCAGEPGSDQVFARAFAKLPSRWDDVVIDLPPQRGLLAFSGLAVAQVAIVVVAAQYLPLKQTTKVLELLEKIRENLNPNLKEIRYLVNQVDTRIRSSTDVADTLRKHLGEAVFETSIRLNCRLSEAPSHGKPVVEYDARSNGALDFIALAQEFAPSTRFKRARVGEVAHVSA